MTAPNGARPTALDSFPRPARLVRVGLLFVSPLSSAHCLTSAHTIFRPGASRVTPMLYLMSTTIIPAEATGIWRVSALTLGEAQQLAAGEFTSAVGHTSTAEAMTELLGQPVKMNRLTVQPVPGDRFLCFKLSRRPPEGAILDRAQLEELGYGWALMEYLE